jgi:rhodanese-related sulfurtransferase
MKTIPISRRLAAAVLCLAAVGVAHGQRLTDADSVSLEIARNELESGRSIVFDIREPQEHAGGVAAGMRLLPMRQLAARLNEIPNDPKRPVLLICNTQNRSSATLKFLREKGYTNVRFVQGGMSEWGKRAWPLVKP